MNVEWDVSGFRVWHVFTVSQVKGDIQEVYDLFIGLDCDFQTELAEDAAQLFF